MTVQQKNKNDKNNQKSSKIEKEKQSPMSGQKHNARGDVGSYPPRYGGKDNLRPICLPEKKWQKFSEKRSINYFT